MKQKRIGIYEVGERIAETRGSYLYRAQNCRNAELEEDYFYALKGYHSEIIPYGTLEREKKISHEIENHAPKSIVIPILEVIKEGEQEYAIMQFRKNGMFLNELITELELLHGKGKIPLSISFEIISEILHSLKVLHTFWKKDRQIGYLHLDLHPGNIFFESIDIGKEELGKVKFIDFLSTLKMEQGEVLFHEDAMILANAYSSPEQKEQEYYKYRPATDLYSVGAILFRLLTGETMRSEEMCEEDIRKLLIRKVPGGTEHATMQNMLCTFIECSMEENPKFRYQSAESMLEALENLKKCHKAYEEKNYYLLFSIAYEMVIPVDKTDIFSNLHFGKFRAGVNQLENDLHQDRINVPRCKYLFECFWNCMKIQADEVPVDIQYKLYSSGIACCNHTGDSLRAKAFFEEIEKFKQHLPLMDYLGCLNRAAVMYADRYEFDKAYEIACGNIKSLEAVKAVYKSVAEHNGIQQLDESSRIIDLGRAYSAKATYMILAKKGDPIPEFEKALNEFGGDIGNRKITLSHMLQYAVEIQDKALYEKYKNEYFGEYSTLSAGLDLVSDKNRFNEYALLTFLKGVHTFYMEEFDSICREKIRALMDAEAVKELDSHPLHLIYRYIGLILYAYEKEVTIDVENAMLASMTCLDLIKIDVSRPMNIMMCMNYHTMWLYNELTEQEEENKELLELMMAHCRNSGWSKLYKELEKTASIKAVLRYEY